MKKYYLILIFLFLSLTGCLSTHHAKLNPLSPDEVVNLFVDVYGTSDISEVSPYLSATFRENLPREQWSIQAWNQLKSIEYKRVSGKIVESKQNENESAVIVDSVISTLAGETKQKELYMLIRDKRRGWLIDRLEIGDEKIKDRLLAL